MGQQYNLTIEQEARAFKNKKAFDAMGRVLEVGQKVVYNYSGSLAVGTIESISVGRQKYIYGTHTTRSVTVKIRQVHASNERSMIVSTVKNTQGIVVIDMWPWQMGL